MPSRQTATHIAALFGAVLTTTLIIGSQLGLASHYTQQSDEVMAASRTVFAQAASAAGRGKRSG